MVKICTPMHGKLFSDSSSPPRFSQAQPAACANTVNSRRFLNPGLHTKQGFEFRTSESGLHSNGLALAPIVLSLDMARACAEARDERRKCWKMHDAFWAAGPEDAGAPRECRKGRETGETGSQCAGAPVS